MAYTKTISTLKQQESTHWDIADALVTEIKNSGDWDQLAAALEAEGLDYKTSTLKAYHRVARGFPSTDRVTGASFAAHQAALTAGNNAQARVAISRARDNAGKVTRDSVLAEVRRMKGRTTNDTSDAVAAWRDLRRGVAKLLELAPGELEALLSIDSGAFGGQAGPLSKDLVKVGLAISEALRAAESKIKADKATKATRAARRQGAETPRAPATAKPKTPANTTTPPKPKVGRMRQDRGI